MLGENHRESCRHVLRDEIRPGRRATDIGEQLKGVPEDLRSSIRSPAHRTVRPTPRARRSAATWPTGAAMSEAGASGPTGSSPSVARYPQLCVWPSPKAFILPTSSCLKLSAVVSDEPPGLGDVIGGSGSQGPQADIGIAAKVSVDAMMILSCGRAAIRSGSAVNPSMTGISIIEHDDFDVGSATVRSMPCGRRRPRRRRRSWDRFRANGSAGRE